jgi:hypothetical protein
VGGTDVGLGGGVGLAVGFGVGLGVGVACDVGPGPPPVADAGVLVAPARGVAVPRRVLVGALVAPAPALVAVPPAAVGVEMTMGEDDEGWRTSAIAVRAMKKMMLIPSAASAPTVARDERPAVDAGKGRVGGGDELVMVTLPWARGVAATR